MKKVINKIIQVFLVATLIFTSLSLKNDSDVEAASQEGINLSLTWLQDKEESYRPGEIIYLKGEWDLPDDSQDKFYRGGDSFSIKIPDGLTPQLSYIPLRGENGIILAEGRLVGDELVFTFTEDIEQKINRKGGFNLKLSVGTPDEEGQVPVPIDFVDDKGQSLLKDVITVNNEQGEVIGGTSEVFAKGDYGIQTKEGLKWFIRVNQSGELRDEETITVSDFLGDNHEIIPETFVVNRSEPYNWGNQGFPIEADVEFSEDLKSFSIELPEISKYFYTIIYETRYVGNYQEDIKNADQNGNIDLENTAYAHGKNTGEIAMDANDENNLTTGSFDLGGWARGHKDLKGRLKVHKIDGDTGRSLEGVTFKIAHHEGFYNQKHTTDEHGIINLKDIPTGLYTIEEVEAPSGYRKAEPMTVFVSHLEDAEYEFRVINRQIPTEIDAKKVWKDGHGNSLEAQEDIVFELYANDVLFRIAPLKKGASSVKFKNLPQIDEKGKEIKYEIREKDVSDKYEVEFGIAENDYTVTNQIKIEKTDLKIDKKWLNAKGMEMDPLEEIEIVLNQKLLGETSKVTSQKLSVDETRVEFKDLPKNDEMGNPITYSIEEISNKDYKTTLEQVDENHFILSNQVEVNQIDFEVNKAWFNAKGEDMEASQDIEIQLLQNDQVIATKTLQKGESRLVFKNLDDKDINGQPFTYTAREKDVENFEAKYVHEENKTDVENHYVIPKTSIKGVKVWKDLAGNDIGSHSAIEIILKANGQEFKRFELAKDQYDFEFKDLNVTDENGEKIEYSLEEVGVNGFRSDIEFNDKDYKEGYTATITNTKEVEKTDIRGRKVWFDYDGKVLDVELETAIQVDLLRDGEVIDTVELEKGEYDFVFKDLDKTDQNGVPYDYKVVEHELSGFISRVSYDEETHQFIISNKQERPVIPEEPEVPEPVEPEEPEVPEPVEPEEPEVPEPVEPEEPEVPEPVEPEEPEVPEPVEPEEPEVPEPVEPEEPEVPEPVEPEEPEVPEPVEPLVPEVEEVLEVQVLPQTGQGVSGIVYTGLAGFILGFILYLKDRKDQ